MTASTPSQPVLQPVASWGRIDRPLHELRPQFDRHHLALGEETPGQRHGGLPFGNGRSYGDVCLNPGGRLWTTGGLDRFMAFDRERGVITCESGVLLDDIIRVALPHGWFLPVTPGTRFVTLGGAIANDVHGKNHHRAGTFGEHVLDLELARTDGARLSCSASQNADWLRATIGGLGLTGLIVSASLQLKPVPGPWLATESIAFERLEDFFELARDSEAEWDYTVSWVDCVHGEGKALRGIFFRGNPVAHTAPAPRSRPRRLPFTPPVSLVNAVSLRAFNALYFAVHSRRRGTQIQHVLPFFYPLDGLLQWNRMYGPRGFFQYQCVLPRSVEVEATAELMQAIRRSGQGSFLAVLKTFADRRPAGLLSFPMPGTTIALDFPNRGDPTRSLFARLDEIVAAAGGRLYAAKDACMPRRLFEQGYPLRETFAAFRDPGISSAFSRRLLGH